MDDVWDLDESFAALDVNQCMTLHVKKSSSQGEVLQQPWEHFQEYLLTHLTTNDIMLLLTFKKIDI